MEVADNIREDFLQRIEDTIDDYINEVIFDLNEDLRGEELDNLVDNELYRADIRLLLMEILEEEYF